jgi:hypothetical protein
MIFGRGGGGGIVNRVLKRSTLSPYRAFTGSADNWGDFRFTGDVDQPLSGNVGVRLNAMYEGGKSFRNHVELHRYGITAVRICGVCTTVHAIASCRAVEDALDIEIPACANIIRNLVLGMQFVHDHVMHFYHLHALDWVDVVSALKADPNEAAKIAKSISPWPTSDAAYFKAVQDRLKKYVGSGQLGIFANGYWGHPAYKLPPAVNLIGVAHYLQTLEWQRDAVRLQTIFGG